MKVPYAGKVTIEGKTFIMIPKVSCEECGFGQTVTYMPHNKGSLELTENHASGCKNADEK